MGSTSDLCSCPRDSDYWESIRSGFEEQSSRDREDELVVNGNDSSSDISTCAKEQEVPKVFPKRFISAKSEGSSVKMMSTKETTSSFFNKIMENARSILSMRCSAIHPTAPLNEEPTKDTEDTCVCETWPASTSRASPSPYDTCIEKSECCLCEDKTTDNSYSHELSAGSNSCSCCRTPASGTPKFFKATEIPQDPLPNDKSDKQIQYATEKKSRACSCNRSTVSDKVQTVPQPAPALASCACATSSTLANRPKRNKVCSAQQYSKENTSVPQENQGTNTSPRAMNIWTKPPKEQSNMAKSASEANKANKSPNGAQKRKGCNISSCPVAKKVRSRSNVREARHETNQCAFVGSPCLKPTVDTQRSNPPANIPTTKSFGCCCNNTDSNQLIQMLSELASQEKGIKNQLNDLLEREKHYDNMLSNHQRNTKSEKSCCCKPKHESRSKSPGGDFETISQELRMENCKLKSDLMEMKLELRHCLEKVEGPMKAKLEAEKAKCICLQTELSKASQNMVVNKDMYEREMNSLKLQLCIACSNMTELNGINKRLQEELSSLDCMCAKLEEDLMKQKLSEAETIRRLQRRCPEVDTDKFKQKPDEAPTLKETFKCDSNLHVIARKLSKTLKDSAPCEECSKLPEELASAARCIRDLTDMVESRKVSKPDGDGLRKNSYSQSLPRTETVFCQCIEQRDIGAGETVANTAVQHKVDVTTVYSAPPTAFVEGQESAQGIQLPTTASAAEPVDATKSKYFDAQGDTGQPVSPNLGDEPCSEPCLHEDAACGPGKLPCAQATAGKVPPATAGVEGAQGQVLQGKPQPCPQSCYVDGVPCPRQVDAGIPTAPASPDGLTAHSGLSVARDTTEHILKKVEEMNQAKQPASQTAAQVSEAGDKAKPIEGSGEDTQLEKVSQVEEPSKPYESAPSGEPPTSTQPSSTSKPSAISKISASGEPSTISKPSATSEPSEAVSKPSATSKLSDQQAEVPTSVVPKDAVPLTIVEREEGNFPFKVIAKGEVLSEPPAGLNVTTVVTGSGNLEVITEGPQGLIETTLNYSEEDGTIEVITQISEVPGEDEPSSRPSSATTEMSLKKSGLSKKSDVRSEDAKVAFDVQEKSAVEKSSTVSSAPGLSGRETEQSIPSGMTTESSTAPTSVSESKPSEGTTQVGQVDAIPESQVPTLRETLSAQQGEAAPDQKSSQVRDEQKEPTEAGVAAPDDFQGEEVPIDQKISQGEDVPIYQKTSQGEKVPIDQQPPQDEKPPIDQPTLSTTASMELSKSSKPETDQSDTFPKSTGSELTPIDTSTVTEKISQKDQAEVTEPGGDAKSTGSEMAPSEKTEASAGPSAVIETTEKSSGLETPAQKDTGVHDGSDLVLTHDMESVPSAKQIEQSLSESKEHGAPGDEPKAEEGQGEEAKGTSAVVSEGKMEEELAQGASAKTSAITDRESKKSVPEQCAEQPLKGQKRDCGCQSSSQTEQSCQCCECKDVGVPSSQDSETITEDKMTYGKLPPDASEHAQLQKPKGSQHSQRVGQGEPTDSKGKVSTTHSAASGRPVGEPKRTDSSITDKGPASASTGPESSASATKSQTSRGVEDLTSAIRSQASGGVEDLVSATRSKASRGPEEAVSAARSQASKAAEDSVSATRSQASRAPDGSVSPIRSQASRSAEGADPAVKESKGRDPAAKSQEAAEGEAELIKGRKGADSSIGDRPSRGPEGADPRAGAEGVGGLEETVGSKIAAEKSKDSADKDGIDAIKERASKDQKDPDYTFGERTRRAKEEPGADEGKLAPLDETEEFTDALGPTTASVSSGRDERGETTADKAATAEAEQTSKGVQKSPERKMEVSVAADDSEPQDASETRFMDAGTSDQPPSRPVTQSDGDGPRQADVSEPLEEFASAQEVLEDGAAAAVPTPVSSKGSKKEAKLKRSSEVPDSVSKLSDKVMPPVRSDGSDQKKPIKKRSPKFDGFTCECHDVCNCTICSPQIIAKRIQETGSPYPPEGVEGQICCCAARPTPPVPDCKKPCPAQVYLQTQAVIRPKVCGASKRPQTTEALLRSTNLDVSESKSKKRISIDDVFVKKKCDAETTCRAAPRKKPVAGCPGCMPRECQVDCVPAQQSTTDCQTDAPGASGAGPRLSPTERQRHPSNCECVDCLCFPKIQELAQTVEFPVVKDEKQIFQVHSMKCNCVNAQNAKKLLERTKIPLPTTSSGRPPKIKISPVGSARCDCDICACTPCPDPKKAPAMSAKPSSAQPPSQPTGEKIDFSKLCDCKDCKCERCFNKPPKTESVPQTETAQSNKKCCCPGDCTCPVCPTEMLQKQLDEEKCKVAQMAEVSKKPSAVSKQVSQAASRASAHSYDCDCSICACPNAPSKPPATMPAIPSTTEKQIKDIPLDHPIDCDCPICECPAAETKKSETPAPPPPTPAASTAPAGDHPEGCTCPECVDCPEGPGKKAKTAVTPKPSEAPKARPTDCDCGEVCSCPGGPTPGARGDQVPPKPSQHKPTCDCATCKCAPCPDTQNVPQRPVTAQAAQGIAACDCPGVCACSPCADPAIQQRQVSAKPSARGEQPQSTPGVCNCGTCACPPKDSLFSVQNPPVASHPAVCTCAVCDCPNKDKVKEQCEQTPREVEHPIDCDCPECECFTTQFSDARVGTTEVKSTHTDQPECDCNKCVCPHLEGGIDVGVSIKENKETHPKDCDCPECQCADIPPTEGVCDAFPTTKRDDKGCCCPDCKCYDCYKLKDTSAHTLDCKCGDCRCVECPKQMGQKGGLISAKPSERAAKPTTSPDAPCPCGDCKCDDCYRKRPHAPVATQCTCNPCLCVECHFDHTTGPAGTASVAGTASKAGAAVASVPPADEAAVKTRSCHCLECECDVCSNQDRKPHKKEQEVVAKVSMTNKSCHCVTCVCKDCINAALKTTASASRKGEGECSCTTCTCKDCSAKRAIGEAKSGQKMDQAKSSKISSRGRTCKCLSCICADCKSKSPGGVMEAKMSETTKAVVQPSDSKHTGKNPNCPCVTCTCSKCQPPPTAGPIETSTCHCETCQCDECKLKKITGGQAVTISAHVSQASPQQPATTIGPSNHAPNCNCVTCECYRSGYAGDEQLVAKVSFKQSEMSKQTKPPSAKPSQQSCPGGPAETPKIVSAKQSEQLNTTESSHKPSHPPTQFTDPPPFEVPQKMPCDCRTCTCVVCREQAAAYTAMFVAQPGRSDEEAPPFEVPVRMPCICETCTCPICVKEPPPPPPRQPPAPQHVDVHRPLPLSALSSNQPQSPAQESPAHQPPTSATVSFHQPSAPGSAHSRPVSAPPSSRGESQIMDIQSTHSNKTQEEVGSMGRPVSAPPSSRREKQCNCPTCTCPNPQMMAASNVQSSHSNRAPTVQSTHSNKTQGEVEGGRPTSAPPGTHSGKLCNCPNCTCPDPAAPDLPTTQSRNMPSGVGSIKSSRHSGKTAESLQESEHPLDCICEKCNCFSEIIEMVDISALDDDSLRKKIQTDKQENCECREQIREIKKALNRIKCACNEAEVKAFKSKPLVKQASVFGQTMSGLKLALSNLQEKCKAKDKMIEAMTGELKTRTSSNYLDKVLNTPIPEAPDYDKAEDVKTTPNAHGEPMTNVLYSMKDDKTTLDSKISKAMETEKAFKSKKKACKCGKSHKSKDNQGVNLAGFEVTDIRRITQDSIIIKWRPPKSSLVNGYDIFVNGVNKSKVMSGGRTSAMIHSLDLTATIQITIYAVTKCGRCEPPAIAIYEIR